MVYCHMSSLPLNYRNPDLIWSAKMLHDHIDDNNISIVDTRTSHAFASGHIPNAKHFDLYFINCDDTDTKPLASFTRMWANLLGWHGIHKDHTIVFYGDFTDMCAARGFWFLEYLGHKDTHVLDGGIKAWSKLGLHLEQKGKIEQPCKFEFEIQGSTLATYTSILKDINDGNGIILDNRSYNEFIGADIRASRGGAIPNAKHLDWEQLYEPDSGCIKSASKLNKIFLNAGLQISDNITVYCNTGYRSAHAYLALRLLGYKRVKNYIGSWQEWGNRMDLPIKIYRKR